MCIACTNSTINIKRIHIPIQLTFAPVGITAYPSLNVSWIAYNYIILCQFYFHLVSLISPAFLKRPSRFSFFYQPHRSSGASLIIIWSLFSDISSLNSCKRTGRVNCWHQYTEKGIQQTNNYREIMVLNTKY